MQRRLSAILLATCITIPLLAARTPSEQPPQKVGTRTAVIDFVEKDGAKPVDLQVVSTESLAVSDMASSLLQTGQIDAHTKGVSKLSEDHYRLTVSFPVSDDEGPLAAGITPPVARIRPCPVYPNQFREHNITGGVVLRLSIDEKAVLRKVEFVSASRPDFVPAAIQAVEKWVFAKPAMKDGKPVAVTMLQLITFEFEGGRPAPLPWQISREPALPQYTVTTSPVFPAAKSAVK